MDCRQVHQAYSVYIQGKLSPHQTSWVTEHIQNCPDCRLLDQKVRNDFVVEKTGQALPEPVPAAAAPAALAMGDLDRASRLRSEDRITWLI
jgi:predicted anti-sigma-YlaC factor YlaD